MDKGCEGCSTNDQCAVQMARECLEYGDSRFENCPCKKCVVKMICEEMCNKWEDITSKAEEFLENMGYDQLPFKQVARDKKYEPM